MTEWNFDMNAMPEDEHVQVIAWPVLADGGAASCSVFYARSCGAVCWMHMPLPPPPTAIAEDA